MFQLRHRSGWGTGNWKRTPSRPHVGTVLFKSISVVAGVGQSEHTIGGHFHRMINTRPAPIEKGLNVEMVTITDFCTDNVTGVRVAVSFGTAIGINQYD